MLAVNGEWIMPYRQLDAKGKPIPRDGPRRGSRPRRSPTAKRTSTTKQSGSFPNRTASGIQYRKRYWLTNEFKDYRAVEAQEREILHNKYKEKGRNSI